MNILVELTDVLNELDIPSATGHFSGVPPDEYIVIIPLADSFEFAADNLPQADVQEARLALYTKGNFTLLRDKILVSLIKQDFTITDRRYIEFEADTSFHHLAIDVAKDYSVEV
jgi:hypothetical protein